MPSEWNHPHPGDSGASAPSAIIPSGRVKAGQWTVSTRSIGEVLTTEIRSDELRLLLFAKPAVETARQIESRLGVLLTSDLGAQDAHSGTSAVPARLQHAIDVLLELVEDVEAATQRRAGALALYHSSREVGCAFIGGGEPDVWSNDQPFDAPWVVMREALDEGEDAARARGFSLFVRPDLDMRLQWPYLLGTPKPEGVLVDARWHAPRGFEVTVRELSDDDVGTKQPVEAPRSAAHSPMTEEPRGSFFAGWFDDLTQKTGDEVEEIDDRREPELPPRAIPPVTQRSSHATAHDPVDLPNLIEQLRAQTERARGPRRAPAPPPQPYEPEDEVLAESQESYDAEAVDALETEAAETYDAESGEAYAAESEETYDEESTEAYAEESQETYDLDSAGEYGAGTYEVETAETTDAESAETYVVEPVEAYEVDSADPYEVEPAETHGGDLTETHEPESAEAFRAGPTERYGSTGAEAIDAAPLPPHPGAPRADAPPEQPSSDSREAKVGEVPRSRRGRPLRGDVGARESIPAASLETTSSRSRKPSPAEPIEALDTGPLVPIVAAPLASTDAAVLDDESYFEGDASLGGELAARPGRTVRRPEWPAFQSRRRRGFAWRNHLWWMALILVLFVFGWWVGARGTSRRTPSSRASFPVQLMRALGLASPRFHVEVRSMPSGAAISIDGKPSSYRTPAELELPLGDHRIGLSLPDLGSVASVVHGTRGATVPLDVTLTGTLQVSAPDASTPVAIVLDGDSRGYAPLQVKGISPGAHELEFTSPGQPPWSQTVTVPIRGDVRVVARPFDLPASGVIHVVATYTDDDGSRDLKGAAVFVDGERRGSTPVTVELARGPHSIRAEYRGEFVPVQVIDLPGGNERYATFSFGTGAMFPKLVLQSPLGPVARDVSTPVTVSLQGLTPRDVREMWLHVRAPDGAWRRYPMTLMSAPSGPVGVVVFPTTMLDARGEAPFYVSLLVTTGEEYFTDVAGAPKSANRDVAKPTKRSRR